MKKFKLLIFVGLLVCISAFGQNDKFKALFIYNFTTYIEWPGGTSGSFIVTVIGDSPIVSELQEISKYKKVGSATIEVKKAGSVAEVGKTNIIYLPPSKKKLLGETAQAMAGKPVLIISDNAQGKFGINFVEMDGKQSFQISKNNIEDARLKVHASLIALGISVN